MATRARKDVQPEATGAQVDFSGAMSYGDYLDLDVLLGAQHPRSASRDELLFIVQHQTSELWLKLALHELRGARERVRADDLQPAFKMLARVSRVLAQLVQSWDVLATLTPTEYSAFRPALGAASGFQSYQYRAIEFLLGNKDARLVAPHRHRPDLAGPLDALLAEPSLYDDAIRVLARRGLPVDLAVVERDVTVPHRFEPSVLAAWLEVYRDPARHWDLYELAEELVDLEDGVRVWRFRHLTTVERIIGAKRGTGGTAGVGYLRHLLDVVLFPELWAVRTEL
jgi:tryptophan 2,3-dioxygenase